MIIDDFEDDIVEQHTKQTDHFRENSFPQQQSFQKSPGIPVAQFFSKLSLPKISLGASGGMSTVFIIIGVIGIIAAGILTTLYFFHTATLTILYQPDKINKKLTVNELPVSKQTKTFSDTATIETTGTKEVGEKAQGNITIYNALDNEQTIPSGTKFTAEGGKVFVLDKALSVKAATQTITSDGNILTTTSKTDASLSAQDIGPEFNIKKDTELTIEGKNKKDLLQSLRKHFQEAQKKICRLFQKLTMKR